MRQPCKICGNLIIPAVGNRISKILVAGEFPGQEEIRSGIPFVGKTGDVLKNESIRAGINISSVRLTNLWCHAKNEERCNIDFHVKEFLKEAKGKKYIMLMGSEFTDIFFSGKDIMDLSGMEMKSKFFPGARVFFSVNPAFAFHGPVGEIKLAFRRFAEAVNK